MGGGPGDEFLPSGFDGLQGPDSPRADGPGSPGDLDAFNPSLDESPLDPSTSPDTLVPDQAMDAPGESTEMDLGSDEDGAAEDAVNKPEDAQLSREDNGANLDAD